MLKNWLRKLFLSAAPLLWLSPAVAQETTLAPKEAPSEAPDAVEALDPAQTETPDIDTLKPVPVVQMRDVDPALWVVKDADSTVYLFGTVHVLKPGLSWFDEKVKDAFDKSDSLVLELVEPSQEESQKAFVAAALDKEGKTLRSKLNDEQRGIYEGAMAKIGLPPETFDPFDPWAAAVTMQITALQGSGFDPASGVEAQLTSAAKAAKKPIEGLETIEFQLGVFDKLPQADQVSFLTESAETIGEIGSSLDLLVEKWAEPDPDGLAQMMNEGLTNPRIYSELLTRRNASWAHWINERMKKPGTTFVAVGAGHLAGTTSVPTLLGAYGLKAERVE